MHCRIRQRIPKSWNRNDWEILKEIFNILTHWGNANQNYFAIYLIPVRTAKINKSDDSACWWGWKLMGHLFIAFWEWKLAQPHWKSVLSLLRNLEAGLKVQLFYYWVSTWHPTPQILTQLCLLMPSSHYLGNGTKPFSWPWKPNEDIAHIHDGLQFSCKEKWNN